jgi:hypothetical protein
MNALYKVVWDKFEYACVFEVLEICVHVVPPFDDDSQRITEPPFPLKVSIPLFESHKRGHLRRNRTPFGAGFTVTTTVVVFVHPFPSVPVTVYVVVVAGPAVTVAPVVDDNPVAGLHV